MKLGISSYTFTWASGVKDYLPRVPLTPQDLLNKANELGVNLVQIADNMPLHTIDTGQMEDLIRIATGKGIELEAGAKELTRDNLESYLNISEKINSRILKFVIDQQDYKPAL